MFDSHAHYNDSRFDIDRDEVLRALAAPTKEDPVGVRFVLSCGDSMDSSKQNIELASRYPFLFASGGVHPHKASGFREDDLKELEHWYKDRLIVAIGEIGLDYHYDFSPKDVQKRVFAAQLALAKKLSAPVIIHDREAHADVYELIRDSGVTCGVMHSYSGKKELLRDYLSLGFSISFSGSVTFKNASGLTECAALVPDDRLLIETDAPYLAPVPYRGRRNDSHLMYATALRLAGIRGCTVESLIEQTYHNAKRLFGV